MKRSAFGKLLQRYDYKLPPDCIAALPATPRDSAKLMVYDRRSGCTTDTTFRDLPKFIPKGALLVFNNTKVVPARLTLAKPTGGAVRVLFIDLAGKRLRVLADRSINTGTILSFNNRPIFRAYGREGNYLVLTSARRLNLKNFLERHGEAPLPPYIKNSPLTKKDQRRQYQAVFAKTPGSIAAPTASLHFTPELLRVLSSGRGSASGGKKSGIETAFITLHVGLGTFAPLTPENLKTKSLHGEKYSIGKTTARIINQAVREKRPIIAVGNTALRTLE